MNLRWPQSLSTAFALARELAAKHSETIAASAPLQRKPWQASSPTSAPLPSHTQSTSLSPNPRPPPSSVRSDCGELPICRLTTAEKIAKDAQGLCYCNDDVESPNSSQLKPGDTTIATDVSSLNSLSGSSHPRTLRLDGAIHAAPVHVLIDGGSTHSFIDPCLVERLKLSVIPITPFRAYIGNGDFLSCTHQSLATPLIMQGHEFSVDLFVLSIYGPDVVLGVQWLQQLGKVAHDYANLTMEFTWRETPVLFQGDVANPQPISLYRLHLLQATDAIYSCYELFLVLDSPTSQTEALSLSKDLPSQINSILQQHQEVFSSPKELPPPTTVRPPNLFADGHQTHQRATL